MLYAKIKEEHLGNGYVKSFENCNLSLDDFEKFIETESPFASCRNIDGEYYGSGFIAIKFSNNSNIYELMENQFIKDNGSFIVRMGPEDDESFIVIFCLKDPLFDEQMHGKILQKLKQIFPKARVNDPNHIFYNDGLSSIYSLGNVLTDRYINFMLSI